MSFVEPQSFWVADTFFSFLEWLDAPVRPGIFVSRTREKLGCTCDQIGRTLEPCVCIYIYIYIYIYTRNKLPPSPDVQDVVTALLYIYIYIYIYTHTHLFILCYFDLIKSTYVFQTRGRMVTCLGELRALVAWGLRCDAHEACSLKHYSSDSGTSPAFQLMASRPCLNKKQSCLPLWSKKESIMVLVIWAEYSADLAKAQWPGCWPVSVWSPVGGAVELACEAHPGPAQPPAAL